MTAARSILEIYIDLNIALMFALGLWWALRFALRRTALAAAYPLHLRLVTVLFASVLVSPLLAALLSQGIHALWPGQSLAVSDIAVAAFLQGNIAMPALAFEELLTTRHRWSETLLQGSTAVAVLASAALALGAFGLCVRTIRDAVVLRGIVRRSYLWRRSSRVDIRLSDTVTVPFAVRGLRRRHVVLPSSLVAHPRDTRFVLAHEFQHLRHGDTEWEVLFEVLRPLFFWNPAFWAWKRQFNSLRELSCDQLLVTRRGVDRLAYSTCLLDVCARAIGPCTPRQMHVAFVTSGRAKRDLLRRITALRAMPPTMPHGTPALRWTLALALGAAIAVGTASIRQTQDWSQDRLMLSTVVNLERLEAINRGF